MLRTALVLLLATAIPCAAAGLPEDYAKKGSISVAVIPNYPPLELRDPASGELSGFDVELGNAIAARLGTKMNWQETSFEQMLPSLATGRIDLVLSGMSDIATRHETASFIDYMKTGPQFMVRAARAGEFPDMLALCGKSAGASRRTSIPKEITAWSDAHCVAAGKPAISIVGTEGSADARTQLKQGRIDAAVQGNETLPYVMGLEPDTYLALGTPIALQYTGIAIPVKETGLQQAMAGALDALIADGTYKALLEKWKLTENAVDKAVINGGK